MWACGRCSIGAAATPERTAIRVERAVHLVLGVSHDTKVLAQASRSSASSPGWRRSLGGRRMKLGVCRLFKDAVQAVHVRSPLPTGVQRDGPLAVVALGV